MNELLAWSWLVPVLPLVSFLVGILVCRRLSWRVTAGIAVVMHAVAAAGAIAVAIAWAGLAAEGVRSLVACEVAWFALTPEIVLHLGMLLDPISVMMLVVISVIALLVQVYSIGYMRGDTGAARFFPLLGLFTAAMLGLVVASNLLQLFVCWELVGVASYLLIGFWYHKPSAVAASKKAFILTRFADAFFLAGILLLVLAVGSADIGTLVAPAAVEGLAATATPLFGWNLLTLATLLVFIGAWGKSAMFPLHIWLPDAMEGPTPVSSIIHSATMVVAGIYLVARLFPLVAGSDTTLLVVETTGVVTALFAALVACTQTDIKRILAYSTLSQLGYMMFALGVADLDHPAGYTAALFHVFTHAWFKCLLFLAAGLIIHAVHSNELVAMGGLRRRLPVTWVLTLLACLAISGVPPFAGFFSKDAILLAAWASGSYVGFAVAAAVGAVTAFYMFRFFLLIFHGSHRGDPAVLPAMHEDRTMLGPMLVLALPTVAAGWLGAGFFETRVVPAGSPSAAAHHHAGWVPWLASGLGLAGIVAAWWCYGRTPWQQRALHGPLRHLANKLYIDECWLWFARKLMFRGVAAPAKWCDDHLVDGSVERSATIAQQGGRLIRGFQNGQLHTYLVVMVLAFVLVAIWKGVLV